MQVIEAYSYVIRCGFEASLSHTSADVGYVHHVEGQIFWLPQEESDPDEWVEVGSFSALHLQCGSMIEDDVFEPREWAEQEDAELGEVGAAVFDEGGSWSEALLSLWEDIENFDVLVIRDLMLEEGHRGNGLSSRIIRRIIDTVGYPCGLVAVVPIPVSTHAMTRDEVKSVSAKLASRFEGMGFRQIPGSVVWALSLEHEAEKSVN